MTTATMTPLSEGFEAGGKTSYAAANATLGTGSWFMDDALTGNLSTDRKTGAYSTRIRNSGLVRMNFNKTGAGTVSIQHAVFGTDGSSTWQLWSSTNNGNTWTQVGATVTTSSIGRTMAAEDLRHLQHGKTSVKAQRSCIRWLSGSVGYLHTTTRTGSDELEGSFQLEVTICKNAVSGKTAAWPYQPLKVRANFAGLKKQG